MAHMVEQMAYTGETPWHGLGVKIAPNLTPDEILVAAGLDWKVEKKSLMFQPKDASGALLEVPGKYALVRDKDQRVMDIVSDVYNPVQNAEALAFFNDFCKAGDMAMETAGSLDKGHFVWALANIKQGFALKNGKARDQVEGYLLFSNPHKLNHSINIQFTSVRVVCNNTLRMALDGAASQRFTMWHSQKFEPEQAKKVLGLAKDNIIQFEETAKLLTAAKYAEADLETYFKRVFPITAQAGGANDNTAGTSLRAAQAQAIVESSPGHDFAPGSWWNALNAVTYMTDHIMGRTNDSRMKQAWFGSNVAVKDRALRLAVDYAKAA